MIKIFKEKVIVVDAICGKGKTEYAIKYMNDNKGQKNFIFVTPYLKEVNRIVDRCGFNTPEIDKNKKKIEDFEQLIEGSLNIATTHKLFTHITPIMIEKIKNSNYELILDEVIDVVSETSLKDNDRKALLDIGLLKEVEGVLQRGEEEKIMSFTDEEWAYGGIVNGLKRKSLQIFENKILIWLFPIDIFECFKRIYVLTFMFDGYPIAPYFKLHNIEYTKKQVEEGELVDYYLDDVSYLKTLIDIETNDKINDIGKNKGSFTMYWYKSLEDDDLLQIRKNMVNFIQNKCGAKMKDVIWTTFNENLDKVLNSKAKTNNFISHNLRATNDYIDKTVCLYLVSRNYNPIIKRWFVEKDIEVDQDTYALAEMIQLVFRSAIRKKEPIKLYVPSSRMRRLFTNWINGEIEI